MSETRRTQLGGGAVAVEPGDGTEPYVEWPDCPLCGLDLDIETAMVDVGDDELALRVGELLMDRDWYSVDPPSPQKCLDAAGLDLVVEDHGSHLYVRKARP
jgi:hypothetical protein